MPHERFYNLRYTPSSHRHHFILLHGLAWTGRSAIVFYTVYAKAFDFQAST